MLDIGLYLASQSPRRRDILRQLGVSFAPLSVSVPERFGRDESPAHYATRLAQQKAEAGLAQRQTAGLAPAPVLGADTVVVCDDQLLEKPADRDQALAMLRHLSGRSHEVLSAICLADGDRCELELSVTEVQFRPLSEALIARYWDTGEGRDKAGGYGIQGLGAALVKSLAGSYSGVVGLPIEKLVPLLEQFGVPYWQTSAEQQP